MATVAESTTGQVNERFGNKYVPVVTETGTSVTVSASHVGAFVVCSASGAVTITIPESTAAAGKVFPIGSQIIFFSKGAGGITVAKTGSDTLTGTATAAQNAYRRVTKVAATEWVCS